MIGLPASQQLPVQRLDSSAERAAVRRLAAELRNRPPVCRTKSLIQSEYGRDKYGTLLRRRPHSVTAARRQLAELAGIAFGADRTAFLGGSLCSTTFEAAQERHDSTLDATIQRYSGDWVCELGCGFGAHVARHGSAAYGGELTETGVTLGRMFGLHLQWFDFHEPLSYDLIRAGSTIVTCAAIEQLPSAQPFFENLRRHRQHIANVIQFEPTFRARRTGQLGRLQNEYILRNDYNVDLEHLLLTSTDIELLEFKPDHIGINPLNPSSLFVWRFRK